jgi:hypothetical protein
VHLPPRISEPDLEPALFGKRRRPHYCFGIKPRLDAGHRCLSVWLFQDARQQGVLL